jgi:hypothetical protein
MKCCIPWYNVAYYYIIYERNGYGKTKLKYYEILKQHIYDFKAITYLLHGAESLLRS